MSHARKHRTTPGSNPTTPAAAVKVTPPPKDTTQPASTPNNEVDRKAMIAEAAYLRAEKRSFCPGYELDDWLAAEREIDSALPRPSEEPAMCYLE